MKSVIVLSIATLSLLLLGSDTRTHKYKLDDFYNLEQFRNMMKTELLQLADNGTRNLFLSELRQKYTQPDSIASNDPRLQYFYRNKYLPDYIKNAIIQGKTVFLMTIGEFYLAHPELRDSTKIYNSSRSPEMLTIGSKGSLVGKDIVYGKIWEFRFGFLFIMGQH